MGDKVTALAPALRPPLSRPQFPLAPMCPWRPLLALMVHRRQLEWRQCAIDPREEGPGQEDPGQEDPGVEGIGGASGEEAPFPNPGPEPDPGTRNKKRGASVTLYCKRVEPPTAQGKPGRRRFCAYGRAW